MVSYNTSNQKRNVVQISVFVLPELKEKILERAKKENRSISNFVKNLLQKEARQDA